MKTPFQTSIGACSAWLAAGTLAVLCGTAAFGQEEYDRSTLSTVPEPPIDHLEKPIREHLVEERERLNEVLANQETGRLDLMRAFGAMGQIYFLYEQWEAAEVCLVNALSLAPRDFRWHYYLGVMYSRLGEADKAIASLEEAVKLRPESIPARIRLGRLKFEQGEIEAAEEQYLTVLEVHAEQAAAYNELGRIAHQRGEVERAIELFEKALELQPKADSIHLQLGMAYRDAGDMDRAREHMRLNRQNPVLFPDPLIYGLMAQTRSRSYFLTLGNEHLAEGRFAAATAAFRKAAALAPEDELAHYNLGLALLGSGEREEAVEHFQQAIDLDPDFRDAHFNLGTVLAEENRFEEAVAHFQRAHEIDREDREAHLEWTIALGRVGRREEASRELEKLLRTDPDNARALLAGAAISAQSGRIGEARETSRRVLQLTEDPTLQAQAHLLMGDLSQQENLLTAALGHYQAAGELDTELVEAFAAAGALLGRMGRFREAASSYALVVELVPRDVGARFGQAMALILGEAFSAAREVLEESLVVLPGNVGLGHLLARLLATAPDDSVRDGQRALELAQAAFEQSSTSDYAESVAMAWAELGDFEEAIAWQRRALELATDGLSPTQFDQARRRLALYQSGEPCRTPWK